MKPSDFPVTIYHNPQCSNSRKALALIQAAGIEPMIVEYRAIGWTRPQLEKILRDINVPPRDLLREKEAAPLGLTDAAATNDQILEAMLANPILVNRPIVETPKGTRLCRPPELVLDLLPDAAG